MADFVDLYQYHDYYAVDDLLSDEHKVVRDSVRRWVSQKVKPIIEEYAQKAEFPKHLIPELAQLGALGPTIPPEYGGAGLDYISYGMITMELERGDSGIRSFASVQSSLVMFPIFKYGSEEQKRKYLPKLAKGELIGCFGLTEPNHGSDPGSMESRLEDNGDHYVLNGSKMWITNGSICDIAVVWAKDESGIVRGVILEKDMEGFQRFPIHNKWSLRASDTGELVFDNVKVPKENVLPLAEGLRAPLSCLTQARYGIAWGVIGAAMECFDTAVRYSKERKQFGRPIGSFQLIQAKLADMLTEITKMQLIAWRLGTLMNEGKARPQQVSLAKRNNVYHALQIARDSRQILGAMGITGDYPIMRHMMNLESVITYEGTHEIHTLVLGQDITGFNAFK
ncbi:MAG: acyl-CoA dehydrogenase [Chlorobi bacterium]|nr:acyl-CoA dehydrogenase [Chlorobiota bacterium]